MAHITWQQVAKYGGTGTVGVLFMLVLLFNLAGMDYTHDGDQACFPDCYSEIRINSSYWEIKVEHAGDKDLLFKKQTRSRTLWMNLDRLDEISISEPKIEVELLVGTISKYATVNHPKYGYLRPLKDGDTLIKRVTKSNPYPNRIILHGTKTSNVDVKWSFILENWLMEDIDIDPAWNETGLNVSLALSSGISALTIIPNASNATQVEPVNQTSLLGVLNATNYETSYTLFGMLVEVIGNSLNTFILEDFTSTDRWSISTSTVSNTTYNWTQTCLLFVPNDVNAIQGSYSGRIRYNFNVTREYEWQNDTNATNETDYFPINWTSTCPSENNIVMNVSVDPYGWGRDFVTDWTAYDYFNWSYLGDGSINILWLEIKDAYGYVLNGTNQSLSNTTAWLTEEVNISLLNRTNISSVRFYITEINDSNTTNSDVYIDDVRLINTTVPQRGITIKAFDSYNYSAAITLNTTWQSISNISNQSSQMIWLWYDLDNPKRGVTYRFNYSGGI